MINFMLAKLASVDVFLEMGEAEIVYPGPSSGFPEGFVFDSKVGFVTDNYRHVL